MGLRETPYGNYNFQVNLGDQDPAEVFAGFMEVVLPEARVDVIEYRQGNARELSAMKLPGRVHYGNLVLKRGVMGLANLYEWWDLVRNGSADAPRDVSITLHTEDHQAVVMSWRFVRSWPVSIRFSKLRGKGKAVVVERLELAFDRMDIVFE